MKPIKKTVHHQPSYQLRCDTVEAYVTELGGHLAPVTFDRNGRKIQPYSVSPWADERYDPKMLDLLKALRGDFFCMPFGDNSEPHKTESHLPHGETANLRWKFESIDQEDDGRLTLRLSMNTNARKGRVNKLISVADGQNAVYSKHIVSGMSGPMNLGHHATLKCPDEEGSGLLSFSPFKLGQVFPDWFELPQCKGYQALKPGYEFKSLNKVAMISGEMTDLSRYPARRGYEDLAMIVADPKLDMAWTALSFPKQRYVWFALKDPKVLNGTIMWFSNGGRHYEPWNGRHINVIGLEEVRSYFHYGLAQAAAKNPFNKRGLETVFQMKPDTPTVINYIMAVAITPPGFDRVKSIERDKQGVILISESGKKAKAAVDASFLQTGI